MLTESLEKFNNQKQNAAPGSFAECSIYSIFNDLRRNNQIENQFAARLSWYYKLIYETLRFKSRHSKNRNQPFQTSQNFAGLLMLLRDFCKFRPRFCIIHFTVLQNWKHEKRLETDVPSLESSVFMRITIVLFTFGDRCSTNWAIPLNIRSLQMNTCHLQEIS